MGIGRVRRDEDEKNGGKDAMKGRTEAGVAEAEKALSVDASAPEVASQNVVEGVGDAKDARGRLLDGAGRGNVAAVAVEENLLDGRGEGRANLGKLGHTRDQARREVRVENESEFGDRSFG